MRHEHLHMTVFVMMPISQSVCAAVLLEMAHLVQRCISRAHGPLCSSFRGHSVRHLVAASLFQVKELRGLSGAPISDCKAALEAEGINGDVKKAFEWLRKKGQATVAKANRSANQGLVGLATEGNAAVLVEVNSETDFVARNADFQSFVNRLATAALSAPPTKGGSEATVPIDVEGLLKLKVGAGQEVGDALADLVAKIRENITIRKATRIVSPEGILVSYVHNTVAPSLGTSAAVLVIRTGKAGEANDCVRQFGKRLAMHVVAARPRFLSADSVPEDVKAQEREVFRTQALASGKPEDIVAKMTEGKLRKFLAEVSLMDQPHMIEEGNPRVSEVAKKVAQESKSVIEVTGFVRYTVGEQSMG